MSKDKLASKRNLASFIKKIMPRSLYEKIKEHEIKKAHYNPKERVPYDINHYPQGINYFGHLKANIGLGQGSRLYALAINKADIPSCFIDIPLSNHVKQDVELKDLELTNEPKYSINIFHINPENFFNVEMSFKKDILDYRYNIGVFLWELDHIPESWKEYIDLFDEFWVPSKFVKDVLRKATNKPIIVIPYGMERIDVRSLPKAFDFRDKYTFLTMFDSKSNIERKNPLMVIDAFKMAFEHYPFVRLVVKANNLTKDDKELIDERIKGYDNIELLDKNLSRGELYSLIKASNTLVSLHRAEGFGLPLAEAMMLNVSIIATDYSSTSDFINKNDAYVVPYTLIKSNCTYQNEKDFYWAEPDIKVAKQQMLNAFNNYKKEELLANARNVVKNYLSMKNSSSLMKQRYNELIIKR